MLTELLTTLSTPSKELPYGVYERVQWKNGTETVGSPLTYADLILGTIMYSTSLPGIIEISLHRANTDECLICWIRNENGCWVRS